MAKKTVKQKPSKPAPAKAKGGRPAPKGAAKAGGSKKPGPAAKASGHSGNSKAEVKRARGGSKASSAAEAKAAAGAKPKPTGADAGKTAEAVAKAAPAKAEAPSAKSGRKGITIVTPKPVKKPKPKSGGGTVPALTGSILGMGLGMGRPLIPSGPASAASSQGGDADHHPARKPKSPYTKRQLDRFREVLLAKRRELLGDIDSMENEALKSQSGSLSHLPQHMAEQGSETYEQSLSLDLAAADRVLLREIDSALQRIEDRTYGLCEHTGKPITKERLAELPWARYSIEAAREMERRTT